MERNYILRKGLTIGIILLFVAIVFLPTCSAKISSPQAKTDGPDLKVLSMKILVGYPIHGPSFPYISCEVINVGTSDVTWWHPQGNAHRLFLFPSRICGFCDYGGGPYRPLKPQETRWVRTIDFDHFVRIFPGFFHIWINIGTTDVNPENNIIHGTFYIKGETIIPKTIF